MYCARHTGSACSMLAVVGTMKMIITSFCLDHHPQSCHMPTSVSTFFRSSRSSRSWSAFWSRLNFSNSWARVAALLLASSFNRWYFFTCVRERGGGHRRSVSPGQPSYLPIPPTPHPSPPRAYLILLQGQVSALTLTLLFHPLLKLLPGFFHREHLLFQLIHVPFTLLVMLLSIL